MGQTRRVGFSEFLGVPSLASLGAVIVVAIGGMISHTESIRFAGEDAPIVLFAAMLLFLPVIAVVVARATEARGGDTAYGIVRRDGHPPSVFAAGWLTLGGYACIGALMVQAIALRVDQVLDAFLGTNIPIILLIIPVAVTAGFGELVAPSERTRTRSVLGWIAIAIYALFIGALFVRPPVAIDGAELVAEKSKHWLTGAALAAAALWFVDVLLDYRRQFQRSDRTLAAVVSGCWIGVMLLAIAIATVIVMHPGLFAGSNTIGAESAERHQIGVVALVVTGIACGITLLKSTARLLRVCGGMARDGLLPAALEDIDTETHVPAALLAVTTLATVFLAWMVSAEVLVGVAAATFLWTACLIAAGSMRPGREPPERGLRLPAHPFFPIVAALVAGFTSLVLSNAALVSAIAWLGLGAINYLVLRGGTRELTRVSPVDSGGESEEIPDADGPRVLVCIGPASRVAAMIRLGADLAKARGGDAVILEVVSLLEQVPRGRVQRAAEGEWKALQRRVLAVVGADDPVHPLVRIAPTIQAGILATCRAHDADLVVMDWPIGSDAVKDDHKAMVENVVLGTTVSVAVVRGSIAEGPQNVVVATAGGPDTDAELRLGGALVAANGGRLSVLCVRSPMQSEEDLGKRLRAAIAAAGVEADIKFETDDDPKQLLVKATEDHEVLIVGLTRDRAISRSIAGSLWMDLIRTRTEPTVLVRRAEATRVRWVVRLWDAAFHVLPTLSLSERAEVYALMRHSAQANVDFYVLIVIASAIATFGLFQDSAAVIIGAMLVAPLMSPIVAIAQGIVQGNLRMVRKGASSTLKGTTVSIAVATLFTLLAPATSATSQILARTEPTLLDLGVGLAAGAAAAYGVSRKSVAAALPGVAIAVALVPPLCVIGFGIGSNDSAIAIGATLLYLTNLVAIVLVSAIIFLLLGFYPRQQKRREHVRGAVGLTVVGMLLLAVPLGLSSYETSRVDRLEMVVESEFRREADERGVHLEDVMVDREDGVFVVRATVFASRPIDQGALDTLRDEIEEDTGMDVRLQARVLLVQLLDTDPEGETADEPEPDEEPGPDSEPEPRADAE